MLRYFQSTEHRPAEAASSADTKVDVLHEMRNLVALTVRVPANQGVSWASVKEFVVAL